MTNFTIRGLVAAAAASLSLFSFESPRIKRIETVNFAGLVSAVNTPYVAPGKTKEYSIYGPWMDWASAVRIGSTSQTIVEKKALFNSDGGLLRVKLTASGSRGLRTATITIGCPPIPLTDCRNGDVSFNVMVLSTGTVSSITPDQNLAANSRSTFHVSGTNLDNSTVFLFRTDLKDIQSVTNSASSLSFSGVTGSCGTNRVMVRDVAEGGDFYPFSGGLDVHLANPCDIRTGSTSTLSSGTTSTSGTTTLSSGITSTAPAAGGPDLQPISGTPLFRHLAPNRKVASEPFCHGMYAQAVTAIVKTITVANMTWGVKNAGQTNVSVQFHAQLFRNGALVEDEVVNGLAAGATKTFTFARPQSQTEVARLGLVPDANSQRIYNATGGECVQTIGQATQFDWQDPQYQIVIDQANAVPADINRANNNKSF